MSWAACRALSGLSVTFSIKTSGVGGIGIHPMVFHDVVEECVCVFDHRAHVVFCSFLPVAM